MAQEFVGLNGRVVPIEQAHVSVMDHGFLYGVSFFATMRYEHGRVFLWQWHMERLSKACHALSIPWSPGDSDDASDMLLRNVHEVCKANGLQDAYVRITVTAGDAPLGLHTGAYTEPKTIVLAKQLPMTARMGARAPKRLHKLEQQRTSSETNPRFKSTNYLNNMMGRLELQHALGNQDGEGIFLDWRGFVCEGLVSNVFFRKGNVWHTPEESTGCLPGVTRRWVIQWVRQLGTQLIEGKYTWDQFVAADEMFVCNSIQEIVPVRAISDSHGVVKTWDEYAWTSAAQKENAPSSIMISQAYAMAKKQMPDMDGNVG